MKKTVVVIFALLLCICSVAACGQASKVNVKPDNMSDRVYELGCAALETADEFIAGDISSSTARTKLAAAQRDVDYIVDQETAEHDGTLVGSDVWKDSSVSLNIMLLDYKIQTKEFGTGTMSDVIDQRDSLAELLGK